MMPSFQEIKDECIASKKLWEDPDFPCSSESIFPDYHDPEDWLWKRPREISKKPPKFLIDGSSRFDLGQGALGDCWFIASTAVLATKPDLFGQVVPTDQDFIHGYVGAFRFNFWWFGKWKEVVVDDRLPITAEGELRFVHNRTQENEYWGPLVEKAYAKLNGCYGAIAAGFIRDALVDYTGGISESYNLRREDKLPDNLFEIVQQSHEKGSLMGAAIWNDTGSTREEEMWNGLYKGHAYSITGVLEKRIQGWAMKLIRLRNPWGKSEWKGPWSDGSDEWKAVSDEVKREIQLVIEDDGEFWMTFEDMIKNFNILDIVHLGPETRARLKLPDDSAKWHCNEHHGQWVKGVNAGGNGLASSEELYYKNPQYFVTLKEADKDAMNITGECTLIISLLLKDYRQRRFNPSLKKLIVGFDVHLVRSGKPEMFDSISFAEKTILKRKFSTRTASRELTSRLQLDPGMYVIIPNTFRAGQEAEFLLRIFTFSTAESMEIQEETGPIKPEIEEKAEVKPIGTISSDLYSEFAGEDNVIDARDLRDLLNILCKKEFGETLSFSVEACRSLIAIALTDNKRKGVLDYEETAKLWDDVLFWKKLFKKHDKDQSGCIETWELRHVFKAIGYTLSFRTVVTLAVRFGGKDRTLFFEDFVLCLSKTVTMITAFGEYSKDSPGEARLDIDDWMQTTLGY